MDIISKFKQGDKVIITNLGETYPSFSFRNNYYPLIATYIQRYKPINTRMLKTDDLLHIDIISGYRDYINDLSKRTDLKWKIRLFYLSGKRIYYIISSNENHMLVCNQYAIEKIK